MTAIKCLMVVPASLFDPKDPFTTGVVYMPIGLAYGASALLSNEIDVEVIDLFGNNPQNPQKMGKYVRLGSSNHELAERIKCFQPHLILFYANQLLNHVSLIDSLAFVRKEFPEKIIGVAENTQAVTAYLLDEVGDEFFRNGADFLLTGEMEETLVRICKKIESGVQIQDLELEGVFLVNSKRIKVQKIVDLDSLKIPAWELFPLQNYWSLGYAHGPLQAKKYLPILTSRGCPFPCKFCVVPSTNNRKWRARSAQNVVAEMELLQEKYGISEFHFEDLNPTIQDLRMREISREIMRKDLKVVWKIVAGTKVESIKSVETLQLMRDSGLRYLSISPESGSKRILKEIGKPFDVRHALKMIRASYDLGIKTQGCFVLGYPSENFLDRAKSLWLVVKLTMAGIDEIVVFIMTPVPGSEVFTNYEGQYESLSELSFSPSWRLDFRSLLVWRVLFYGNFLMLKFIRNPIRMLLQITNLFTGKFETKMEMTPIRGLRYLKLARQVR